MYSARKKPHPYPFKSAAIAAKDEVMPEENSTRTVTIPAREQHGGLDSITVTLPWVCRQCGASRGEPYRAWSWDGSRQLAVDGWNNPCGHVELYCEVRRDIEEVQP